jgi:2-(1,2-epoxy-1,2-dihydrophenyl)acetyl-CoA isomerase
MTDNAIVFEKVGRTAVITLNRPKTKNALDRGIRDALPEAFEAARQDALVRSVVLTGAGGDFCSGANLQGVAGEESDKAFAGREIVLDFHRVFAGMVELEKPVIAAVDGVAAGAGLSLALGADFVFATPRARLLAAFMRVGLIPDLSLLYILPRLVGLARAKEIMFSAREVPADEALAIGLVQAVVPAERLRETALEYAQRFDHAPPQALGLTKAILNRSFETDRQAMIQLEAAAQSICAASDYHQEALRRFQAREAPLFAGAGRIA